jgi:hypothetical protein
MEGKTVLNEDADIYRHPDEDLTEQEKLKRMDRRGKWQYFKDYYLRYVLVAGLLVMCVVCVLVFLPEHNTTDTVLYVGFVNESIDPDQEEAVKKNLESVLSFDPAKESVLFDYTLFIQDDNSYLTSNTMTVLTEQFYTGNMDLFVAEKDVFESYEEQGAFLSLEEVFSAEEYEELKGYLYDECSYSLKDSEIYHSFASLDDPVIGICWKSKRVERSIAFIKYLLKGMEE